MAYTCPILQQGKITDINLFESGKYGISGISDTGHCFSSAFERVVKEITNFDGDKFITYERPTIEILGQNLIVFRFYCPYFDRSVEFGIVSPKKIESTTIELNKQKYKNLIDICFNLFEEPLIPRMY